MVALNYDTILPVECTLCRKTHYIKLYKDDIKDWIAGVGYVQDILDYLSSEERELLISGTCNDCWIKLYGDEEEIV